MPPAQIGSALQIYPTTNSTSWIRYYYDTNSQEIRRTSDGTSYTRVAQYVTNQQPFTLEDYAGNILTTNGSANTRVVGPDDAIHPVDLPHHRHLQRPDLRLLLAALQDHAPFALLI